MTTQEFNLEFDILYNNIMSNTAPGLSSYEKSVFLTQAQEEYVNNIYERQIGSFVGFEATERATEYLKNLVTTVTIPIVNNKVELPDNLLYIVREVPNYNENSIFCKSITSPTLEIATHDTLSYKLKNPYYFTSGKVLRVIEGNTIILYSKEELSTYTISYIRKPNPIILEDLPEEYIDTISGEEETVRLSINGISTKSECELDSSTHKTILNMAVNYAKLAWRN